MKGHDAGLKGTLTDGAKSATFTMDALQAGDKYTIAGKEYTIGSATTEVTALIDKANTDATADTANKTVDVNGKHIPLHIMLQAILSRTQMELQLHWIT